MQCSVQSGCRAVFKELCRLTSLMCADIAFPTFEEAGGTNDTYMHVPDPTAVDPESGDSQRLCAPPFCFHRFMHPTKLRAESKHRFIA